MKSLTKLDILQLAADVRELAEERPDHRDPHAASGACRYFDWYEPPEKPDHCGCIIGHGLYRQGYRYTDISQMPRRARDSGSTSLIAGCLPTFDGNGTALYDLLASVVDMADLDSHSLIWLRDVQMKQDGGNTWEDAVAYADREAAEAEGLGQNHE